MDGAIVTILTRRCSLLTAYSERQLTSNHRVQLIVHTQMIKVKEPAIILLLTRRGATPDMWVFWIHASNAARLEAIFLPIRSQLRRIIPSPNRTGVSDIAMMQGRGPRIGKEIIDWIKDAKMRPQMGRLSPKNGAGADVGP